MQIISGFSKLSKLEKIQWLASQHSDQETILNLTRFWHQDEREQKLFDEFSENTLTNYFLPFGIAPNFLINDKFYNVPMVIEESSVVAAASNAAKFWVNRGGFKAEVVSTTKVGQVHFTYSGDGEKLAKLIEDKKVDLLKSVSLITATMEKRGGGVRDLKLVNKTDKLENYYQLYVTFETCDAMGANFINSILEELANQLKVLSSDISIVMSILSNYTPDCKVVAWVECHVNELDGVHEGLSGLQYAQKLKTAVDIAKADVNRAVTHNKGIFNGIDAVVLATGNDFRAVEACAHAYAARNGQYSSLTSVEIIGEQFKFSLEVPLSLGTVGGLTSLHPLAKISLDLLGRPSAPELMKIISCVGLAQNFGALKSLTTTGIQKGHMKMHLINILNQFHASEDEIAQAKVYFVDKIVSYKAVTDFLDRARNPKH